MYIFYLVSVLALSFIILNKIKFPKQELIFNIENKANLKYHEFMTNLYKKKYINDQFD